MPKSENLAVAGFYGDFDLIGLASQANEISKADNPVLETRIKSSDVVPFNTSLRQIVTTSDNLTQDGSDRQAHLESDRQTLEASLRHNVTTSDRQTPEESLRHNVTTSDRRANIKISQGVTEGQKPVLNWLINMCGEETKIVTYKMIHESLSITERAARTHIDALHKKGYIFAEMATRPNSLQPIGKKVFIKPPAHLAMALSNNSYSSDDLTQKGLDRHYVTTSERQTQSASLGQIVTTTDRQTYCSSSINTTTETDEKFGQLVLDDWEKWDLRPRSILEHLDKDLPLLQNLLDKTAYVIQQKEGTDFAIKSKVGFLKRCLENEFCEVDNNFISRKEKIIRLRTEQMKKESARLMAAKEEEKKTAIELLCFQLSEKEMKKIRNQAIEQIRSEMKQPGIEPSNVMIESYLKNILASMAIEKGLFSLEKSNF